MLKASSNVCSKGLGALNKNIYIVGFPSSGKTTYLAGLWHLLLESPSDLQFVLHKLTGDRSYLNTIADQWRSCEPVGRTPLTVREDLEIHVKEKNIDVVSVLRFPDLSGETFDNAFYDRRLSKEDELAIFNSDGIVLFISADTDLRGVRIDSMGSGYTEDNDGNTDSERDWNSEMVQYQVRLVDFFQSCSLYIIPGRGLKISVVISAWDLVNEENVSPSNWLRENMPMLDQFFRNTRTDLDIRVFGVSAQGASFDETLSNEHIDKEPTDRISVLSDEGVSNDLSIPLAWLTK